MNRGNFLVHLMIAVVLIALAAVVGQIGRWRSMLKVQDTTPRKVNTAPSVKVVERDGKPELLVKFKPDVTREEIRRITASLNDRVEDRYEAISGLTAIDDLDYADVSVVLGQYESMSDVVDYVEANQVIALDDPVNRNLRPVEDVPNPVGAPNDPLFGDQWALNNTGQGGGKANAHIDALKAWAKTRGSAEVVVAVLDTGVDYSHTDLAENMWIRPANLPQYTDAELGTIDDLQGYDANANAGDPMDDNGHGTHCAGIIGAEGNNGGGI